MAKLGQFSVSFGGKTGIVSGVISGESNSGVNIVFSMGVTLGVCSIVGGLQSNFRGNVGIS